MRMCFISSRGGMGGVVMLTGQSSGQPTEKMTSVRPDVTLTQGEDGSIYPTSEALFHTQLSLN